MEHSGSSGGGTRTGSEVDQTSSSDEHLRVSCDVGGGGSGCDNSADGGDAVTVSESAIMTTHDRLLNESSAALHVPVGVSDNDLLVDLQVSCAAATASVSRDNRPRALSCNAVLAGLSKRSGCRSAERIDTRRRHQRKRSSSEPPSLSRKARGTTDVNGRYAANVDEKQATPSVESSTLSRRSSTQSSSSLSEAATTTETPPCIIHESEDRPPRAPGHVVSQSMAVPPKGSISDMFSSNLAPIGEGIAPISTSNASGASGDLVSPRTELQSRALTQNFVMEHRIFLRAILQLLNERDQFAVEADANDPHTIKGGPLKKATSLVRGVWKWKVKYVEVRRGLFSYFEDTTDTSSTPLPLTRRRGSATAIDDGSDAVSPVASVDETDDGIGKAAGPGKRANSNLNRKSIPLRAATCTCRAVKVQNKALSHTPLSPNGAVFELTVQGGPRRLWMCNTREERQAWIHAIHEAMIGGSVTRGDNFLEYQVERKRGGGGSNNAIAALPIRSPYRTDLERYLRLQHELKNARSRDEYMGALAELYSGAESLDVPVQWIKERIEVASSGSGPSQAFHEGGLSSGVAQLWKDMLRDSVSINGDIYKGDGGHGPERIIGALARCILSFDKSAIQNVNATRAFRKKFCVTEAQAVSYARDVLLACNRTRSGGDSYYCMDTLCSNQELVVLCPSSSEADPLRVVVRHSVYDECSRRGSNDHGLHDISGWILTRSGPNKSWKKRYGVLSEGVLSYYEQALPRPHGLRGQVLLAGATVGVSQVGNSTENVDRMNEMVPAPDTPTHDAFIRMPARKMRYIVCITSKDRAKERQIIFNDQSEFFLWNQSIRDAVKVSGESARGSGSYNTTTTSTGMFSSIAATSVIANKIRGLSVRAREGVASSSPMRTVSKGRFARTNNADGAKRAEVDVGDDEGDISEPSREHIDRHVMPQVDETRSANWKKIKGGRARSTVEISVQNTAVYKVCSLDPQGDESEDTWAMVRTTFLQNFRLSGGPNGRILRGEEVVQLNCLKGLAADDAFDRVYKTNDEGSEAGEMLRRASLNS